MSTITLAEVEAYNGGSLRRSGKYLRGKCLVHGGNSPTSFQYNPETGHWKCFKCGEWGYIRDGAVSRPTTPAARLEPSKQEIKPVRSDLAGMMANYQTALPGSPGEEYLKRRGISLEVALKYGAGYGKDKNGIERVIFPHTSPSGEIISIYGRAIDDGIKLKHKHMAGNKGVFNAAALFCCMAFLCEGVFDALSLIAAGHENSCAIFGNTGLSNKWQWVKAKILIFCFDNDSGGEKWKQLAAEATLKGKKVYFLEKECYQGYKDLNEVWVKTGKIDVGELPELPEEQKKTEEPSSKVAPSLHHEESFLSTLPELTGLNSAEGELDDLLQGLSPTERAHREAIIIINHQYQSGTYSWAREHHPDLIRLSAFLWEAMDAAAEAGDEPGTRQPGAALVSLWHDLKEKYAAVFGPPPEEWHQDEFIPAELAELDEPAPAEITVTLGPWNKRVLKRDSVRVSKSASGSIICELI